MKVLKGIGYFFVLPILLIGIGFFAGVKCVHFFYPGESHSQISQSEKKLPGGGIEKGADPENAVRSESEVNQQDELITSVTSSGETLSVDTQYVLQETDLIKENMVETVWRLPDKYIGMNREQFLQAMEDYSHFPPLSEMERGFVGLEVLSFSREKVVVKMNYEYLQPTDSFYVAVRDNEVVVYLEDMETIYINTGMQLSDFPEDIQVQIMQMYWIPDEESLYDFLETYSS